MSEEQKDHPVVSTEYKPVMADESEVLKESNELDMENLMSPEVGRPPMTVPIVLAIVALVAAIGIGYVLYQSYVNG